MTRDGMPQEEVFDFLADPAAHGGAKVRRIDTHAASVFLAGDTAFKVKRAVRFPFLDYSSLEKRKRACQAELDVNRPYAPEIYRRVVPITRETGGRLAIGGEGEPLEWAVEMRRFDENATLDRVASAEAASARIWPMRSDAPSPRRMRLRRPFPPERGSRRSPAISTRTRRRSPPCRIFSSPPRARL